MLNNRCSFILFLMMAFSGCQSDPEAVAKQEPSTIDYILVEKAKHTLSLYHQDNLLKTYNIALGREPRGHKEKEGDFRTPEGIYSISKKNPKSRYHRSLKISYPNKQDLANANKKGHHPGGDIMIHGFEPHFWWVSPKHKLQDLTRGCIAVTNSEIEEIFSKTPVGTKVEIRP